MRLVIDVEADGLLDEVTKIHCVSFLDLDTDDVVTYRGDEQEAISRMIEGSTVLVGHNIVGYDLHILEKFYGITTDDIEIFDTLVMSQLFQPDRQLPPGCPTGVKNPVTGKTQTIGPHGLMAWSYKVDGKKPIIFDWRDLPYEVYVERCEEDCITTKKVFEYLLEEYNSYV